MHPNSHSVRTTLSRESAIINSMSLDRELLRPSGSRLSASSECDKSLGPPGFHHYVIASWKINNYQLIIDTQILSRASKLENNQKRKSIFIHNIRFSKLTKFNSLSSLNYWIDWFTNKTDSIKLNTSIVIRIYSHPA